MSRHKPSRPEGLPSPVRRAIEELAQEIPIESCCLISLRFILLLLLFIFGFTYAGSQPKVYHDVLIWQQYSTPPYTVYVYRNLTSWIDSDFGSNITVYESFLWNETSSPGCPPYNCNDTRFTNTGGAGCDEGWLQASRIGFEDSLGFRGDGEEPDVFYIDKYVFWMVVVFGGVGVGHCLVCLCHALQPEGIGFYRYEAVMDIMLAMAFLALGIFPLAWLPNGRVGGTGFPERWNYTVSDQLFKNRHDLRTTTAMGWVCFVLFTVLAALNILLVSKLDMFKKIAKRMPGNAARDALVENIPGFGPISITGSYRTDHGSLRRRSSGGNGV